MPEGQMEVGSEGTRLITAKLVCCVLGTGNNLYSSLVVCSRNSDREEARSSTLASFGCSLYSRDNPVSPVRLAWEDDVLMTATGWS